jgi:hypothetical protein
MGVDKKANRYHRKQLKTDQSMPDVLTIFPIQKKARAGDQETGEAKALVKGPKKPDGPKKLQ